MCNKKQTKKWNIEACNAEKGQNRLTLDLCTCYSGFTMSPSKHSHINALQDMCRDFLHHLIRIVFDTQMDGNSISMMVKLLIQSCFQLKISRRKHKIFFDHSTRLPSWFHGCILDLSDHHAHNGLFIGPVISNRGF